MSDNAYQDIVAGYPRLLAENNCIVASTALLWFDFALTFTTEIRLVWQRKLSGALVIYLLTRYVALAERIFFILEVLVWNSSDETCRFITHTDDVLTTLSYIAISLFTVLRIRGLWGREWIPLLIITPLTLVKPVLYIVESVNYTAAQAGPPVGCAYIYTLSDATLGQLSIAAKATTITSEAILVILTWLRTFDTNFRQRIRMPITAILFRDGTAYFIVLLSIQLVTITATQLGSNYAIWLVWPYFDQVLTVIFLSRFILDLRDANEREMPLVFHGEVKSNSCFNMLSIVGHLDTVLTHQGDHLSSDVARQSELDFVCPDVRESIGEADGRCETGSILEMSRMQATEEPKPDGNGSSGTT